MSSDYDELSAINVKENNHLVSEYVISTAGFKMLQSRKIWLGLKFTRPQISSLPQCLRGLAIIINITITIRPCMGIIFDCISSN